jgi:hypothetical protein
MKKNKYTVRYTGKKPKGFIQAITRIEKMVDRLPNPTITSKGYNPIVIVDKMLGFRCELPCKYFYIAVWNDVKKRYEMK